MLDDIKNILLVSIWTTAKQQKSISLATRAEATYAEYRRQKSNASGGRGFRLPLCWRRCMCNGSYPAAAEVRKMPLAVRGLNG